MTEFVMVPLSRAPYPPEFLDSLNGYATGGSGRCREAIEAEGAWIERRAASPQPGPVVGDREAVARIIRQHVKVDATGLAPAVASAFIVGEQDAADAILAALASRPDGGWRPIEEHDGSDAPVLLLDDEGDCPLTGQFIGGEWLKCGDGDSFYPQPTRFHAITLPPAPSGEGG